MSDVSSVTSHFATANEGFNTTTSGTTTSGGNTVSLNSVAGLTNDAVFVGVIEPGTSKEQVFTGVVDVSGSRITGVVWTKGTNVEHSTGVPVVDYDTGTSHNMMVKGFLVQHKQDGSHANTITTDTINENTVANGVTIDGFKVKDGVLQTANAINKASLEKSHYNSLFFATDQGTVLSNVQTDIAFSASSSNGFGISAVTGSNSYLKVARDGVYTLNARFACIDVSASAFIFWFYISVNAGVNYTGLRFNDTAIPVGQGVDYSVTLFLPADARVKGNWYNGGGATRMGLANNGNTSAEALREFTTGMSVTEVR